MTTAGPPRVLVTRAAEDAGPLSHALHEAGLQPVEVPAIHRLWDVPAVAVFARDNPEVDVVVVTSAAVADVIAAAAPLAWVGARLAAVGPATAARLATLGYVVDVTPQRATARDLLAALGDLSGKVVAWPHGDLAPASTMEELAAVGADVRHVVAYRNLEPPDFARRLGRVLPVAVTTLMSGSAATRVAALVPPPERWRLGKVVVVGPSTRSAAVESGLPVHVEADQPSNHGVVQAVLRALVS